MIKEMRIVEEARKPMSMQPKKFALWLFMVSSSMLFAAWTSAYIVRQGAGNWMVFDLPRLFWFNTGIILLSSVTMHWAYLSAKRDNLRALKAALFVTLGLGLIFLVGQFLAWGELVSNKVYFVGNPSGSFVYVLSGVHGLHIVSGIVFLLIVSVPAMRDKIHSKNKLSLELCTTYWHFLDGLWLYLFVFLLLNR